MPYPIAPVSTDNTALREAREEGLRSFITQHLLDEYSQKNPDLMLDVVVSRRSDYDEVKVFLIKPALVEQTETFLRRVEEELSAEGIAILTYVRTWTGPASLAAQ